VTSKPTSRPLLAANDWLLTFRVQAPGKQQVFPSEVECGLRTWLVFNDNNYPPTESCIPASNLLLLKPIVFTVRAIERHHILPLLIQMEGGRSKTDQQVGPDQPDRKSTLHSPSNVADCIGKRGRSIKDEDATEHARKRPRTQENTHPSAVNERHQIPKGKRRSQPSRKSTRLQEIRDSSQQGIARAERQTKPLPRPTKTPPSVGQEQPQVERRALKAIRKCQLDCVIDVFIYNADQRSQTTPRSQGQGRKTTRMLPDEPNGQTGRLISSSYAIKLTQV
jgi:hypothetical protein